MQYCLTLELKNDPELIATYEQYHSPKQVWPEVISAIRDSGITDMAIHRVGTTLIMILQTDDSFSFTEKAKQDAMNPRVQAWERLMEQFQNVDSNNQQGKWQLVERIFSLEEQVG
ncbi:L-fucose mutarotase [Pseudoalteromonas sp. XI10]|uniref:L-rhamnose mutarotase n=1 Tax=Pseudoalteromonas sp. XI10 TaxID=1766621 RepID=UPI0007335DE2|nr:L-rhamnose mutarotase [Pseudoalteromonas sp. XI10]KTG20859.1 L-fucose mutarotase [Pseudoalteromonas sp. XI10]